VAALGDWLARIARSNPCGGDGRARVRGKAIYILPTGAGLGFAVVLLLMVLGSLNYQNNLGLLFTFLMASVGVVAMHHTWLNLRGLEVVARSGSPVFAGEEAVFTLRLIHEGRRRRGDLSAAVDGKRTQTVGVGPGESVSVRLRVPATERGRCRLPRVQVETRYPLGLFRAWCYIDAVAAVTVYPRPAERSPEPAPVASYRQSASGDRGVGADDFVGLRGYHPGDSLRRVDWKALGRERGLVVKQFGGDRADQVWLDWSRLPGVDREARLGLLCRQVLDAADRDLTFGLRLPQRQIPMGRGDVHRHRCLEALALYGRD
jgi:uncharacterized protein (DUF58 family)